MSQINKQKKKRETFTLCIEVFFLSISNAWKFDRKSFSFPQNHVKGSGILCTIKSKIFVFYFFSDSNIVERHCTNETPAANCIVGWSRAWYYCLWMWAKYPWKFVDKQHQNDKLHAKIHAPRVDLLFSKSSTDRIKIHQIYTTHTFSSKVIHTANCMHRTRKKILSHCLPKQFSRPMFPKMRRMTAIQWMNFWVEADKHKSKFQRQHRTKIKQNKGGHTRVHK